MRFSLLELECNYLKYAGNRILKLALVFYEGFRIFKYLSFSHKSL